MKEIALVNVPLVVRRSKLKEITGFSPAKIDELERGGKFPKRRHWSAGIVGYYGPDIVAWAEDLAAKTKGGTRQ